MTIPEWYLPLLEKIQKNLNEQDLALLQSIINREIVPNKDQLKYLWKKMTSWLNTWEIMKFWKMLLHLSITNG